MTALNTTTRTYVQSEGYEVDVENLNDSSILELIQKEEKAIKALAALETRPACLETELTNRKEGLTKLVAALDARDERRKADAAKA